MIFNLAASITERFAAFCGLILDNQGVDGVINGVAASAMDVGNVMRKPQTGRIRNYVLIATAVATAVLIAVFIIGVGASESRAETLSAVIP